MNYNTQLLQITINILLNYLKIELKLKTYYLFK